MSVSTIKINGKDVIVVDVTNMTSDNEKEIVDTLHKGSALVATKPQKSVNIITVVTSLRFNSAVADAFKEYATANTPYVKDSVIVGLSGIQHVIFSAVKALTKRDFQLVDTLDEAKKHFEG